MRSVLVGLSELRIRDRLCRSEALQRPPRILIVGMKDKATVFLDALFDIFQYELLIPSGVCASLILYCGLKLLLAILKLNKWVLFADHIMIFIERGFNNH